MGFLVRWLRPGEIREQTVGLLGREREYIVATPRAPSAEDVGDAVNNVIQVGKDRPAVVPTSDRSHRGFKYAGHCDLFGVVGFFEVHRRKPCVKPRGDEPTERLPRATYLSRED